MAVYQAVDLGGFMVADPRNMNVLGKIAFGLASLNPDFLLNYNQQLEGKRQAQQKQALIEQELMREQEAARIAREKAQGLQGAVADIVKGGLDSSALANLAQYDPNAALSQFQSMQREQAMAQQEAAKRQMKMREDAVKQSALASLTENMPPEKRQQFSALYNLDPKSAASIIQQENELMRLKNMPQEDQELFLRAYGKGGTTVNVGGQESPFKEKFLEKLGSERASQIVKLEEDAGGQIKKSMSARNAFELLNANPNINISPISKIDTTIKSLFANYLSEDELKNIADYQTLDSQLVQNRMAETEILKGAITEKEQEAAQTIAGRLTGTLLGLKKTLAKNIAVSEVAADYLQRKALSISERGEAFDPKKFEEEYKKLGADGFRPTVFGIMEDMLGNQSSGLILGDDGIYRIQ